MTDVKHPKLLLPRRQFLKYASASAVVAGFPTIIPSRALGQSKGMKKLVLGDAPFISKGPAMIAFEKGFFKKMGIDLEYKWFMDGGLIVAPMISGEIDLGTLTPSAGIFNAISRGADIQMFLDGGTTLSRERAYGVTVVSQKLWEDGIRKPSDLKKIADLPAHMSVKGSINQFTLDKTYMAGGVDPRKVQYNYGLSQPTAMKLMLKGGVNVTNFAYHFAWLLEKRKKAKAIALSYDVAPGSVISCYSYTRDKLKDVGREHFVRFAMAYIAGVRLFTKAATTKPIPEDIIKILTTHTLFKGKRGRNMLSNIQPHWAQHKPDVQPHKPGLAMMQDHWVDYRKYVQKNITMDQLVNEDIAREAVERYNKEKPFGDI